MSTYTLRTANPAKTRCDAVVVGVVQGSKGLMVAPGGEDVANAYGRTFRPLLSALGVTGKAGEVTKVPTGKQVASPLLILVGLGKLGADETPATAVVRRAAGAAARSVTNAASVAIALPAATPELVRAVTEGFVLGGYTFTAYKKSNDDSKPGQPGEVVVLCPSARKKEFIAAFADAQVVTEAVADTRTWVNTPPGDLTPPSFAEAVEAAVKEVTKGRGAPKVTVRVRDEKELAELGCGGILGVGQGSSAPPRLVELGYAPRGAVAHLALVGKGITFDSGGLTLKPGTGMNEMKSDMAGAAAVIQATLAIARLGLPLKVTTYAPMAENMPSGAAIRPSDVLTMRSGKRVEVTNTDAEGRLILADAIARAAEDKPDVILDVATLTGAQLVALGARTTGVMANDDDLRSSVVDAAERAGEPSWPMPLPPELRKGLDSEIADLVNSGPREGGMLLAGIFLKEFVPDGIRWAHRDIAGPAYNSADGYGYTPHGGTGAGVRTFVQFLEDQQ